MMANPFRYATFITLPHPAAPCAGLLCTAAHAHQPTLCKIMQSHLRHALRISLPGGTLDVMWKLLMDQLG